MIEIFEKIIAKLDPFIEPIFKRTEEWIDQKILSKLNDRSLNIASWITNVLSKVFLIYIIMGCPISLYIFGINAYYGNSITNISYYGWLSLITDLILPILLSFIPYIIMRISFMSLEKTVHQMPDQKSIFFATGFFLIASRIQSLINIVEAIIHVIEEAILNSPLMLLNLLTPFVNSIITTLYILIAIKYLKESDCLIIKRADTI